MIIYGTRTKTIMGVQESEYTCPHCNTKDHISFGHLRYLHVFWIPFLTIKKNVGLICSHCKKTTFGPTALGSSRYDAHKSIIFSSGKKFLYNFGLMVIGFIILLSMITSLFV